MRIHTTDLGHRFVTGSRRRPIATPQSHPHLFKSVADFGDLPAAPSSFDYFGASAAAQSNILLNGGDPVVIDGKEVGPLGDCTAAGACHIVECVTGLAGDPVVFDDAHCCTFYSQSTGYVLGDPSTDQGGDEVTVLTSWRDRGLDGKGAHRILGFLAVPLVAETIKRVCHVFENLYFGLELSAGWMNLAYQNGYVWSGGTPDPSEGHCVVAGGADEKGPKINSWGMLGTITYDATIQYCAQKAGGTLFVVITREVLGRAKLKTPEGFDFPALEQWFDRLGGHVPVDTAAPAPSLLQRIEQEAEAVVQDVERIFAPAPQSPQDASAPPEPPAPEPAHPDAAPGGSDGAPGGQP